MPILQLSPCCRSSAAGAAVRLQLLLPVLLLVLLLQAGQAPAHVNSNQQTVNMYSKQSFVVPLNFHHPGCAVLPFV
jgi:hypothetical protein